MSIEVVALFLLLLMFIVSAFWSVNIGVLAFVTSFLIFTFTGSITLDNIYESFPADLFVLLVGVTYLFVIIQKNGTLDLITSLGLNMVKGNLGMIPWVFFFIAVLLTSIGTSGIATASILGALGLRIAFQHKISPLLMGIMIQAGCMAGGFSPVNIFGIVVNGVMKSEGIPFSETTLYINTFTFYLFLALIAFTMLGGIRLFKESKNEQVIMGIMAGAVYEKPENRPKVKISNLISIIGVVLLMVFVIGFDMNIGFAALSIGLLLSFMSPKTLGEVFKDMPWSVVVMVSGIVTYVGIMEQLGTMEWMQQVVLKIGNPNIAALAVSYTGGIISAFASTTGFLAAIIPLGVPIITDPTISTMGVISSLSISSSIVDLSPFSTVGAMFLANVQGIPERTFFKQLLVTAGIFVLLGPLISWLIFVVIGGAL